MGEHARLGPSSAKQWMECPPSVAFGEQFPDRGSSYADEGSAAHTLSEMCIKGWLKMITHDEWTAQYTAFTTTNKFWNDEMDAHCKEFAGWIYERVATRPGAMVFLEQRLDLSRWIPEGFGTGDVIIVWEEDGVGYLEIIDLKYGKGVPVKSQNNPQLKCYALGALAAYDVLYEIHNVWATIYQPRLPDDTVTAEYTVGELTEWADTDLKPAADLAWAGGGEFKPGGHCQFCRGRSQCATRIEKAAVDAFANDPEDPMMEPEVLPALFEQNLLSEDQFLYWLNRAPMLIKVLGSLQDEATRRLASGEQVPGYKLVAGRSNRKFKSEMEVTEILQKEPNPERFFQPVRLLSLGKVEKEIGAKRFKELLSDKVIKALGKPTLVPESDGRPALEPSAAAQAAFGEGDDE